MLVNNEEPIDSFDDDSEELLCRTCGGPNDDGEGYDGECGTCADATFNESALEDELDEGDDYCMECGVPTNGTVYCDICTDQAFCSNTDDDGEYKVTVILTDAAGDEIAVEEANYDNPEGARMAYDSAANAIYGTDTDVTGQNDEPVVQSTTNQTQENTNTMNVTKQKAEFKPVTFTFTDESEFHDFVAAVAAYGRKTASVSGTSIASDLKLSAYSGNSRKTVNRLLPQLIAAV